MQNQTTTNATATTIQTTNPTNATPTQPPTEDDWMSDDDNDMYDLIDFGIASNGGRLSMQR
jgi:hypothetical protein